MNRTIIIAAAVLLILGGGAFLLLNNQNRVSQPQPTQTEDTTIENNMPAEDSTADEMTESTDGATMEGEVKEFTVTGNTNFRFNPAEIKVKKGDTVKITFKNAGGFHDFILEDFNVKTKQLPAGQSETVTFSADKTGTFEYYCSVGNHRQMGMVGKLIVE